MAEIERELNNLKLQCESVKSSLALPDRVKMSVNAELNRVIEQLDAKIQYIKKMSEELNRIIQVYENTEGKIVEAVSGETVTLQEDSQSSTVEEEGEFNWDAWIESFMDTWIGDVLAGVGIVSTKEQVISKTLSDMKNGMTLAESINDTWEFTKGMIQSVPKYATDMIESAITLVDFMVGLPTMVENMPTIMQNTYRDYGRELGQLCSRINENGFGNTITEIAETAWQDVKTQYDDAFVNAPARERGENTGRAVITVIEIATAVKAIKALSTSINGLGRIANSVDDDLARLGKLADDIPPVGDDVAKVLDDDVGGKWEINFEIKTKPSKVPNILAEPKGKRTKIYYSKMDYETIRSLIRENEAASTLAKVGYDIEQNPVIDGLKNPD